MNKIMKKEITIMKKIFAVLLVLVFAFASLSALAETQIISVPNDSTNLCRAIKLLEAAGFIEVDPAVGDTPEIKDITKYIYDIEINPVAANTLTATLADCAAATINGTWAVPYGLIATRDGLLIENQDFENNPRVNIIVARTADAENEIYKTVVDAYQTQFVAEYLRVHFKDAFFPAFEYDTDFTVEEGWDKTVETYESSKQDKDGNDKIVVKVGVCGGDNSMWSAVQQVLDEQEAGIYIELVIFDAYNLPNEALNSGDIDLNAFQHKAYLKNDCDANGYDLIVIGDTLTAPLTLYSEKFDSVDAIKEAAGLL